MNYQELFIVALRIIGVLQIIQAVEAAVAAIDFTFGFSHTTTSSVASCFVHFIIFFTIGLVLLAFPRQLIAFFKPMPPLKDRPPEN